MQRWEYLQVYTPGEYWLDSRGRSGRCAKMKIGAHGWTYHLAPLLNQLGVEGWELVAKDADLLLLKRPKP